MRRVIAAKVTKALQQRRFLHSLLLNNVGGDLSQDHDQSTGALRIIRCSVP